MNQIQKIGLAKNCSKNSPGSVFSNCCCLGKPGLHLIRERAHAGRGRELADASIGQQLRQLRYVGRDALRTEFGPSLAGRGYCKSIG
jgi:hypothetical protein